MKLHSKKYLIIGMLLLLVAMAYPLYNYFIPTKEISDTKTDEKISTTGMLKDFETNAGSADAKYSGKIVEISGKVHKISDEGAAQVVIFDEGGKYVITAGIDPKENVDVGAGDEISLKGLYSGIILNDMLPVNDIKIEQCSIVE